LANSKNEKINREEELEVFRKYGDDMASCHPRRIRGGNKKYKTHRRLKHRKTTKRKRK
jgi:hypothetical protein